MTALRPVPIAALFLAALPAQNYSVSPAIATTREASGNNTAPWWSATHRYQQVHGDLRNRALQIRELAFRRDGVLGTLTTAVARTVDADLKMGPSRYATAATTFASNYTGPATQVVVRKLVNLPDFTANQGAPAPWNLVIPCDVPFAHAGVEDFVWDLSIHSTTNTGAYALDAYSGFGVTTNDGTTADYGTGCTVLGRGAPMTLTATTTALTGPNRIEASWTSSNGTGSAATAIFIGAANPDVAVPGLCTRLYSDLAVLIGGTANPAGTFSTGTLTTPFQDALAHRQLFCQAWCPDPGQGGLPFAGSQGLAVTIADLPARVRRIWADDVTAATGNLSEPFDFGLVVRFTHQ